MVWTSELAGLSSEVHYSVPFFQLMKYLRIMLCSNEFDFQSIKQMIDVGKYKSWMERTGYQRQAKIWSCMDESVKHSTKLSVCCGAISKQILKSAQDIVCSDKAEEKSSTMCWILIITNRDETKRLLFKIIEKSNICNNCCPLDHDHDKKSKTEQNHNKKNKRQFDLASTFDTIGQFMCEDVLEGSTQDGLHFLFKELSEGNKDDNPVQHKYFWYMLLVRRPVCCLLQSEQSG